MKNVLMVLLFVLTTTLTFAQSNYQDVVYLKNGSIIRGMIIEQIPNKSIKIETSDRSIFVYPMDEIEKLTKELDQSKRGNTTGSRSGYRGIVETGYQVGVGSYSNGRLKLNIVNGYQFSPYFSMGLGVGLRYYTDEEEALIPIFADFRANFMDNKVTPYFSLGAGYSFDPGNDLRGVGFLLNPAFGIKFNLSEKVGIHVGIDYEMQRATFSHYSVNYYYPYTSNYYTTSGSMDAIGLSFGVSF